MLRDENEGMSTIPGFSQIQFEGFCRFIDQGLTEELHKFPKIEDTDQEIEFQLFVETYQLVEPLIKERDAVYESLTYSSELYVPAGLIWKPGRDMQEQTLFIGNIPLMNSLGTFIVNGIYRIVINQILQSPGIYYRSELDHNGIAVYTGTIISDWGGRSELEIDRKARIWARVSRKQKISILVLLSAMGSNLREILDNDQLGLALVRLENVVRGTICGAIRHKLIPTPQNLVTSTPLTTTYESFFRTTPFISIHGRKLSYLGPGGLTGRTASFRIRDIHPSHYGRICPIDTSEGINVGLIGSLAIHARIGHWGSIETQVFYLAPSIDEYYMVATGNSLALNRDIQEEQVVPARYPFFPSNIFFSIGASLIPFIEHNDANRALMSSNMQRQAVPLSRSEKCIVGTGLERQAALDSGVSAIAECEGKIVYTDTDKIVLSGNGDTISIPLVMYQRSNKKHLYASKPQAPRVAYMPWEGYNFEDAVLISERLAYADIYTSFHIRKYEIQTHVTSQGPERITKEIPHLEAHLLRNLDRNGIVMLGSWVETGDILVGKLTPQAAKESSYAPEDRLLRAILGIQVSTAKETCLKLPIGEGAGLLM
ncbi:hypothetical protein H6P81_021655 [Aristolochia fimbriata]|uniref:DNA-directed RNA polymerase n=1 Tax=Aristolochia fimbriata TaxID=158543 RepID=A0AAV7DQY7_ARIFI|nr:hypothetical protein H6P81_021655 [Aristolochia fimbriata]